MTPRAYLISEGFDEASVDAFLAIAKENLEVGRAFKKYAQEAAQAGKKVGAKAIMERVL